MLINQILQLLGELSEQTPKVDTSNVMYFNPKYAGANRGYPPHPCQVKIDKIKCLLETAKRQRMEAING